MLRDDDGGQQQHAVYSQAKSFGCALLPPPPRPGVITKQPVNGYSTEAALVRCAAVFIYLYLFRTYSPSFSPVFRQPTNHNKQQASPATAMALAFDVGGRSVGPKGSVRDADDAVIVGWVEEVCGRLENGTVLSWLAGCCYMMHSAYWNDLDLSSGGR